MKRFPLYLTLITILGLTLRIIFLQTRGSFWFDELFTLELAKLPFLEMFKLASQDTNPPLWTIIMWPWVHIVPHTEWLIRLPALFFGTLTIPFIGYMGKKLSDKKVGILAATFTAISPPLIYFSTEARMYALLVFLTVFSSWLLLLYLYDQKLWAKILYPISIFLLMMTHVYGIILIVALYIWGATKNALFKERETFTLGKPLQNWHISHALLVIIFSTFNNLSNENCEGSIANTLIFSLARILVYLSNSSFFIPAKSTSMTFFCA